MPIGKTGDQSSESPGWERISSSEADTESTTPPSPVSSVMPDTSTADSQFNGSEGDMPWWRDQDEIVISGVSGRFPRSDNVTEYGDLLLAGEDLVTEDDLRWPPGFYDLPLRHGKLKDLKKFDASFFGVPPKQANFMDPQQRLLMEVAYEAMIDAGINPQVLRGTKTGVFIGCSASETGGALTQDPEVVTGYTLTGCVRSMFSNRLSYCFDLRGPSFSVDAACSSSLLALQLAVDSIRQGQCDAAIVGGSQLTLTPTAAIQFLRLGMLSERGSCRSFDSSGDGYCRTECVSAILLQKRSSAHRIYATVMHAKSNTDGYKEQGITFPSGERQATLLEETYREAGVDPNTVVYVEAHGTGTKVGDPQEANAICEVFCSNRTEPLLIGSVKSNMGHAEPASGVASVAKMLLAMERGYIPPNLHYEEPNPYIPGLQDGRLKVVTEKTPFHGGVIGINSFGFGGSNTHIVLRSHPKTATLPPTIAPSFPKLMTYSGRTTDSVHNILKAIEDNKDDPYFHQLLSEQANLAPKDCPFRGYTILNRENAQPPLKDAQKITITESRPIWFVYSGMGSQWAGMGKKLMQIPCYAESIHACCKALDGTGVDLYSILMSDNPDIFKNNTLNCMLGICAIQIALTDMLQIMGVHPDGIVGHSTGEMGCSYADGGVTREQAMQLAFHRGNTIINGNLGTDGGMAAVGLTWEEATRRCPEGVVPACHNGHDSVTISGKADKIQEFIEELKKEEVFAKYVDSSGVPFHSPLMQKVKPAMLASMRTVIPEGHGKPRSSRWVSTSIPEHEWESELARTCSADYHVNNACSPVLFHEALQKIPANAVTIEVAPHCLLQAVLRRSLHKTCTNVGLMNMKAENELESFLMALGKVYQAGVTINIREIYPPVSYPVPLGTPMIAPLWRWDHAVDFPVIDGCHLAAGGTGGIPAACSFTVDPFSAESKEQYLLDHMVDGRVLYPFTGHMVLAWKALCKVKGLDFQKTPVIMENINVYRPTILSKAVKLDVVVTPGNGNFEIMDGDQLAASGRITIVEDDRPFYYADINKIPTSDTADRIELDTEDAYKEFLLRGYEYGQAFRGIYRTCNSGERGTLYWTGNWVTFLDSLLQTALLAERADTLRLPVRVRYLRVDPVKHLEHVEERDGIQVIELRNDIATNGCVAGGVECCDLVAQTVPRRLHASGRVYLERLYFIKQLDDRALEEFPKERTDLSAYRDHLRSVLARGLKRWSDKGILSKLKNGGLFTEAYKSLAGVSTNVDEELLSKCLEESKCQLVQTLHKIFSLELENGDVAALEEKAVSLMRTDLLLLDYDKLWAACLSQDRILKPLQDMVVENSAGHNSRFGAVELNSVEQLKYGVEAMSSHPLLETDWVCVGPNVDQLDENSLGQIGARKSTIDLDAGGTPNADTKNFDMTLLDKVLSTKTDIPRYLQKVKELMRDDGIALVIEVTKDFETALAIKGLLGDLLEAGDGSRRLGSYLTHEQWLKMFEDCGFNVFCYQTDPCMMTTCYGIRKIPEHPREPIFVDVDDIKEFSWIEPLQKLIEERLNEPEYKTIWLTSTAVRDNGLVGLALCFMEENLKFNRFRTIMDMSVNKKTREGPPVIDMNSAEVQKIIQRDLHANNYRDGEWGSMRHIVVKEDEMHSYKETEHAFINTLVRGDLASLTWVESPNQFFGALENRKATQEMCSVYYSAVNFRDVMLATGRLPPDAIPGKFADRDCLLGMEFAGRLNSNGKRVMGILPAQALATTVVVDTDYSWEVPETWSLADAATVPVVYTTAYYALIMRGRMRRGDKVLIHSGSGGVGQAAIAIALSYGCEVYTTVGSDEKRNFLKKRFPQLTDKHFSNSRSTDFEWHIRQVTNGRGVDIILNSLAEEKLQASLRCLATHGRFLEIGKFDLSNNSNLGMAMFLKNVTFHGILLDALMDQSIGQFDDWKEVAAMLEQGIKSGVVQPLSSSVFTSEKAEEAFRFMATGKHIGKVLMEIRPEEKEMTIPRPIKVRAVCRTLCHPAHVYLVTGGLGGFGLELAQWLINRGARRLVLTSRTGIRTGYQARCVHFWRRTGVSVLVSTLNIAEGDATRRLIKQCQEMGKIGGVFHLAMVLRDCLFENQNAQNFKEAAEAKYHGTKWLDKATRELCDKDLRWFVVFSSITSGRGNAGQTNYGWSNSTMERMIEHRREDGYPGIAIQWGAIGDVGVILENMGDNNTVVGGTLPQRMPSCLAALDLFLSWNHPIVSSYIRADTGTKKAAGGGNLLQTIAHILGVNDITQLNPDANLGDLGLDSLMGVEIKQALERDYDIVLSMKDIRTLTLNKLQQMADAGGTAAASGLNRTELDLKKESEKQAEMNTAEMLEKQMNQLFKMRIDVNDLGPQEVVTKCNKVEEGPACFFVHSIEGIATPLRRVTTKCNFPAYCFQSTRDVPHDSIESVAACYIRAMKKIQPKGPYRIIGYSYGACIGFEMATMLQESDGPDAVEKLILMDGSHLYMQTYRKVYRLAFGVTGDSLVNNPLFETEIMCAMTLRFANVDYKKFRIELLQLPGFKARVQKVVDTVMTTGLFKSADTVAFAVESMRAKFLMADQYKPARTFKGLITLIRAEQGAAREEDVGRDYGLNAVADSVDVYMVEGDHDTFVQGKSSGKTASIVNDLIGTPSPPEAAEQK